MYEALLSSLFQVFQLSNLLFIVLGVAVGIFIGALPGLSVTLGVALMLPFTFALPPATGILFLLGIYCGGTFGGSITAILLKTPGSPASAATAEDGYALAKQGKASQALNLSLFSSASAGLFSGVALLLISPLIAQFALRFGPPEYFSLAVFGMTIIASVSGDKLSKGLLMASLGILFSTVGQDPIMGSTRLNFGFEFLISGFDLLPVLIGLFAVSEILKKVGEKSVSISERTNYIHNKFRFKNMKPFRKIVFKSSIIGTIIGSIPGTGAEVSSFISYNEAKRSSKEPEKFGKGSLEGIAASEAGNNGVTGATLIPMMTLGIPGGIIAAILLGALIVQGLTPGPQLFSEHGDIAYTIIIGFILANAFLFIQGKYAIKWLAKVTLVPASILYPIVLGLCLIGAYAYTNSLYTVWVTLFFGLLGFILYKYGYPLPPLLIAVILGPIVETSLRQSLILSRGSFMIFVERPISLFFILLILISILFPLIRDKINNKKK